MPDFSRHSSRHHTAPAADAATAPVETAVTTPAGEVPTGVAWPI